MFGARRVEATEGTAPQLLCLPGVATSDLLPAQLAQAARDRRPLLVREPVGPSHDQLIALVLDDDLGHGLGTGPPPLLRAKEVVVHLVGDLGRADETGSESSGVADAHVYDLHFVARLVRLEMLVPDKASCTRVSRFRRTFSSRR